MVVANASRPNTGWVRIASIRSVAVSWASIRPSPLVTCAATPAAQAASASADVAAAGSPAGRWWGRSSACRNASTPWPLRATVATTGTPRRRDRSSVSRISPRLAARSIMFSATTSRGQRASSWPTSTRLRGRLQASTMTTTASGADPLVSSSTATAICASGDSTSRS